MQDKNTVFQEIISNMYFQYNSFIYSNPNYTTPSSYDQKIMDQEDKDVESTYSALLDAGDNGLDIKDLKRIADLYQMYFTSIENTFDNEAFNQGLKFKMYLDPKEYIFALITTGNICTHCGADMGLLGSTVDLSIKVLFKPWIDPNLTCTEQLYKCSKCFSCNSEYDSEIDVSANSIMEGLDEDE